MNSRFRRLTADFQRINSVFSSHSHIALSSYEGDPPDHYVFNIKVPGLEMPKEGKDPLIKHTHLIELFLLLDYPKRPPFCRMLSSVFHPNINPSKICIGDHWSAGQSLAQLIVRIAEMICFQSYNVKSPLNAEAAAWAEINENRFPLLQDDLGIFL